MAKITHPFQSAIPDGPDNTLVQPSDWNADHVIPADGVLVGDSGTNDISGVTAGRYGQYLIRKFYAAPAQYEFRDLPDYIVPDYDFPAISPSVSLTASVSNTVAISADIIGIQPVSAGLHRLRIVDNNSALTEVVLLTAGTTNGSLVFTPANSHVAGQYTITSATSGIQECIAYVTSRSGGKCFMPIGNYTVYAETNLTMASGISMKLYGVSPAWSMVVRDASYPAGNVFTYSGTSRGNGSLIVEDFRVLGANGFQNPSGYAFGVSDVDNSRIFFNRVWVFDGNGGFFLQNASNLQMSACQYLESAGQVLAGYAAAESGLRIVGQQSDLHFVSCAFQTQYRGVLTNVLNVGIYINGVDGAQFINCVSNGSYGVRLFADAANTILNVFFVNHICDECFLYALRVEGSTTSIYSNLYFVRCHFNGYGANANQNVSISGNCDYVYLLNCNCNLALADSIQIDSSGTAYHGGAKKCIWISEGEVSASGTAATPNLVAVSIANGSSGVHIRNLCISKRADIPSTLTYGIAFIGNADNCSIIGCSIQDYATAPVFIGGTLTDFVLQSNPGIDDIIPNVASNSALSFPVNPLFKLTGTTSVNSVSGLWAGRSGTLITPDGTVTFTAGATIANTRTTVQNVPLSFYFDGTQIYLR